MNEGIERKNESKIRHENTSPSETVAPVNNWKVWGSVISNITMSVGAAISLIFIGQGIGNSFSNGYSRINGNFDVKANTQDLSNISNNLANSNNVRNLDL